MLLEVIVAFTVAALVMSAAFELLSRNMGGLERIDDTTRATLAAEAKLASVGIAEPLAAGTRDDELPGGLVRRTEIQPVFTARDGTLQVPLYHVQVTVFWRRGLGTRSLALDGLRLAQQ